MRTKIMPVFVSRLREIEHQRIQTGMSFDDPETQDGGGEEGGHSSDSDDRCKWISPDGKSKHEGGGETPRQVLPMSVKSVIYGQEDISEDEDRDRIAIGVSGSRCMPLFHLLKSTYVYKLT